MQWGPMSRLLTGFFLACVSSSLAVGSMLGKEEGSSWMMSVLAFLGFVGALLLLARVAGQGRSWSLIVGAVFSLLALVFGLATVGAYQAAQPEIPPLVLLAFTALQAAFAFFFFFNFRRFESRAAKAERELVAAALRAGSGTPVRGARQPATRRFPLPPEQSTYGRVLLFSLTIGIALATVHLLPVGEGNRLEVFILVLVLGSVASGIITEEFAQRLLRVVGWGKDVEGT